MATGSGQKCPVHGVWGRRQVGGLFVSEHSSVDYEQPRVLESSRISASAVQIHGQTEISAVPMAMRRRDPRPGGAWHLSCRLSTGHYRVPRCTERLWTD
jgi:hypothetical protein